MFEAQRKRTWEIVEQAHEGDNASRVFDSCLFFLIVLNIITLILETVDSLAREYGGFFRLVEVVSVALFTLEYLARLWACRSDERYARPILGRLRHALRPMSIIDLLAIAPFYLPLLFGISDFRFFRIFRLFRILRVFKLAKYSNALQMISRVFDTRKEEIFITSSTLVILVIFSAALMYYVEHDAQPEAFASIPDTIWWAIVTLTTVGYGDVYPVTALGRLCAGIIAALGIGMVALPTGIISSGFVEEFDKQRRAERAADNDCCPHCGQRLPED